MVRGEKPHIEGILMCILVIHILIFLGGGRQKCPAATGIHTVPGQNTLERTTSGYLASEVLRRRATRWQCGSSSQGWVRSRGAVKVWRGNKEMFKVTRKACMKQGGGQFGSNKATPRFPAHKWIHNTVKSTKDYWGAKQFGVSNH